MLVLSRKERECIRIGKDIIVCVVQIQHDKIRLGIEAPRNVTINREEVHQAIERQKGGDN